MWFLYYCVVVTYNCAKKKKKSEGKLVLSGTRRVASTFCVCPV